MYASMHTDHVDRHMFIDMHRKVHFPRTYIFQREKPINSGTLHIEPPLLFPSTILNMEKLSFTCTYMYYGDFGFLGVSMYAPNHEMAVYQI
jgi:hypothetical protein